MQVEIYHIQLQVQLWLLSTKLQDFTQQAIQGAGKHCRLACMSLGLMPCKNVPEGIEISIIDWLL